MKLEQVRVEVFSTSGVPSREHYVMVHLPTGVRAEAPVRQDCVRKLVQTLVARGELKLNVAREVLMEEG